MLNRYITPKLASSPPGAFQIWTMEHRQACSRVFWTFLPANKLDYLLSGKPWKVRTWSRYVLTTSANIYTTIIGGLITLWDTVGHGLNAKFVWDHLYNYGNLTN